MLNANGYGRCHEGNAELVCGSRLLCYECSVTGLHMRGLAEYPVAFLHTFCRHAVNCLPLSHVVIIQTIIQLACLPCGWHAHVQDLESSWLALCSC